MTWVSEGLQVHAVPQNVYKIRDAKGQSESWFFNLVIVDKEGCSELEARELVVEIWGASGLRETTTWPAAVLEEMRRVSYRPTAETDELSPKHLMKHEECFDMRLSFPNKPRTWNADQLVIKLVCASGNREPITHQMRVPLKVFEQKTQLILPLKKPGIITQGPINNGGHSGHANQFSIDFMGLNASYGPVNDGQEGLSYFAGWGQEIVAPGSGIVVYVRKDVPDCPPESNPMEIYGALSDPIRARAGNCVVINHENGEYSALMHLQKGSVSIAEGARVERGQVIGKMGSSGDAFGVHLHYQLQDGPDFFRANPLPIKFENLDGVELVRGVYVTPQ